MSAERVITVNAATKLVSTDPATIAVHENVKVVLRSVSPASAADLELALIFRTALVAECFEFTLNGTDYEGALNLGDARLIACFAGHGSRDKLAFDLAVYDRGAAQLLVNARLEIQTNPYTPGMALPTPGE
jgi:hypothetical protein